MANKYKIKEGVIFRPYGAMSSITNENLTDSMAEMFLKKNPSLLHSIFEELNQNTEVIVEVKKKGRRKKSI